MRRRMVQGALWAALGLVLVQGCVIKIGPGTGEWGEGGGTSTGEGVTTGGGTAHRVQRHDGRRLEERQDAGERIPGGSALCMRRDIPAA